MRVVCNTSTIAVRRAVSIGYNLARWRLLRKVQLEREPWCRYCFLRRCRHKRSAAGNCWTAATVVDHVVPHRGNPALFWNPANLQSLCKLCHDSVKQMEENAPACDANGYPLLEDKT